MAGFMIVYVYDCGVLSIQTMRAGRLYMKRATMAALNV